MVSHSGCFQPPTPEAFSPLPTPCVARRSLSFQSLIPSYLSLGIAQPKGVLLYGPPGTGKRLLARAVAYHTDCTFIRASGSELVQNYIGEGSRMVRELFVMVREHTPSIIFMDEIHSIGSA